MEYKKNDLLTVTIEDMGHDGEGIGKVDGYTVFVKDTVIGDKVQAKIMKAKKNYGYARLVEIMEPSKTGRATLCVRPSVRRLQIQALSYEKQLAYKQQKIENNLIRIGGFQKEEIPMQPIIGMEDPYHYRNKAQVSGGMRQRRPSDRWILCRKNPFDHQQPEMLSRRGSQRTDPESGAGAYGSI